jgi:hypothetical protein
MRAIAMCDRAREVALVNRLLFSVDRSPVVAIVCLALYFGQSTIASAANRAPSISGTPATTAYVGKAYSFQPTASDPDGNKLTFKIAVKPAWATFSSATGSLTGTPASSHIGTYSKIVISVSDGRVTKSLPAFSIKVVQAASTVSPVTLSWMPPTQNVDGTQLSNLAGYRIHYGQVSGQYDYSVSVGSPSITSATIANLAPARWYFAVTAVTSSGTQSDYSAQLSKAVL